jgi:hypothetical protein
LSWPNSNSDLLYYKILSLFNATGCCFGEISNFGLIDFISFTYLLP